MSYLVMDVSRYNTITDWTSVATQIDGVIIRAGYRGYSNGTLVEDPSFQSHISGAYAAGIPLSVYFFSQAITEAEAIKEAEYTVSLIGDYKMHMPIFIDSEYSNSNHDGRADSLSASTRTAIVKAFCNRIEELGYTAGIYASDSWYNSQLNQSNLTDYKFWVAKYSTSSPIYVSNYIGWQYTSSGSITGVDGDVDLSYWYEEIGITSSNIIVGSARIDENGNATGGEAGDQKQTSSSNDTIGEVSMQSMYTHSLGWYILRPLKASHATLLAAKMIRACNNACIGYNQNDRLGIITYGTDTETNTNCDCSSLVRQCVIEATGTDPGNFTTANEVSYLTATGLFSDAITYVDQATTPVYNGDILVTKSKGHTVIVVSGNARAADSTIVYYPAYTGTSVSIIEGLQAVGANDTSFAYRTIIANVNGISNYTGTASQNTSLLNLLKAGLLIDPDGGEDNIGPTITITSNSCGLLTFTVTDNVEVTSVTDNGNELDLSSIYSITGTGTTHNIIATDSSGNTSTKEVTIQDHSYVSTVIDPTCTSEGYTTHICSVCGDSYTSDITNALGHNYVDTVVKPTCTEDGYTNHRCSRCGDSYNDTEVEATGHSYTSEIVDPTCTEQGYTIYTCEEGDDSYKDNYTDALGHDYQLFESVKATCETEGYDLYVCSRCNDSYKDNITEALGHDWEVSEIVESTCTTEGYTLYKCTHCGETYKDNYTDLKEHSLVYVETVNPTCTEEGYDIYLCENCDSELHYNYTSPLGHLFKEPTFEWYNNHNSCTAYFKCSRCDEVVSIECTCGKHTDLASCEEEGLVVYTASVEFNGISYSTKYAETIEKTGHNYVINKIVEPTCTSKGYTEYICTQCGDTYKDNYIDALEHDYQTTKIIEATCTEDGYTEQTCSRCNDIIKINIVEALGHDEEIVVTDPTYLEDGYIAYKCSRCGISKTDIIGKLEIYTGLVIDILNTNIYPSPLSKFVQSIKTGTFFAWDDKVVNNRIKITNKIAYCGLTSLITGWINVADIGKTIEISNGTKYELGDIIVLKKNNLYTTHSTSKISHILTGKYYIAKSVSINKRLAICEKYSDAGIESKILGWVKISEL